MVDLSLEPEICPQKRALCSAPWCRGFCALEASQQGNRPSWVICRMINQSTPRKNNATNLPSCVSGKNDCRPPESDDRRTKNSATQVYDRIPRIQLRCFELPSYARQPALFLASDEAEHNRFA